MEPSTTTSHRPKRVFPTLLIFVMAPLIAVLLTTFVFQSYEVSGMSMQETLHDRDRLIVWKMPQTIARVTGRPAIPGRYEIVILKHNLDDLMAGSDDQIIKRVIGLPGERVTIKGNTVTIYNKDYPGGFNPDTDKGYILGSRFDANLDIVVPEDHIFVLGDNRGNSLDSSEFGSVLVKDVVGVLRLRVFPINKAQSFSAE